MSIKNIELAIIEKAYQEGWVRPRPALQKTGHSVAIVGSGPAGLAAAQQLARRGHAVTVFEKESQVGGLLRFGIPDFKIEKRFIDRRIEQLSQEGVVFRTRTEVGSTLTLDDLQRDYSAVGIAIGAEKPRDLNVPGRSLQGVHFAMEYLSRQNKVNAGMEQDDPHHPLHGKGKKIVVIGGGDTGADCYGTALRQGCAKVYQLEIRPRPSQYKFSSSHEEGVHRGGERRWSTSTLEILGDEKRRVRGVKVTELEWKGNLSQSKPGSEKIIEADLVLLAMGFVGIKPHSHSGTDSNTDSNNDCATNPAGTDFDTDTASIPRTVSWQGLSLTERGVISTLQSHSQTPVRTRFQTQRPGVFVAGDARRGASLIVWAIAEGRDMADEVDRFLTRSF